MRYAMGYKVKVEVKGTNEPVFKKYFECYFPDDNTIGIPCSKFQSFLKAARKLVENGCEFKCEIIGAHPMSGVKL